MTDIANLSLEELKDLQSRLDGEIKARTKEEISKVQQQIQALADSIGMTVEQIMTPHGMKIKKAGKTVGSRFRHPQKPELQWSGRGRKPLWIQEYLDQSGKDMNSLLIEGK